MPYFQWNGKNIYYEEYGSGYPLLLLNGIMMSCASWTEFVEPLSRQNHLILLDMLDQGKSDKMDSFFSQKLQVELVNSLLEYLNLEDIGVMGISYGSEVALQLALQYPKRVEKLVLFNATAATGPWLGDIGDAWNKAAGNGEAYYLTTIPVIYSPEFYKKNKDWMDRRRERLVPVFSNPGFAGSMVRLTRSSEEYDVREQLGGITAPTLVVSSQQDYLTPIEEQEFIVSRIPRCDHVIIPGCGHASMYEKPVIFTSLVLGFINNTKNVYDIG